ncbi:MAG: transposase [Candidatus Omnitrophica bacterium]|nr:transposase [Candidatus Omnitrophota bacterium]
MPRIARGLVDGFIYHVLNRGNALQKIFHKDKDYEVFINLMKEAKERYPVKIFAYCLMPNHFHMVLMPQIGEELSKFMQWLMTSHVRRYHVHYGSSGHVWQGRFKSFIVQKDNHLLTVLRYVEGNPVRAGLVKCAKDWLWSSHNARIGNGEDYFIDEPPIEIPKLWDKYVNEPLTDNELERLRQSVNRQSPYGDNRWQIKITQRFGLESTLRPIGRPKKKKDDDKK